MGGTAIVAVFGLIWRLSSKVDRIGDAVVELGKDIREIKKDGNIVRWSDLRHTRARRRHRDF